MLNRIEDTESAPDAVERADRQSAIMRGLQAALRREREQLGRNFETGGRMD